MLIMLTLAGCGSGGGDGAASSAWVGPMTSPVLVTMESRYEEIDAAAPALPAPTTFTVNGSSELTIEQPALGWFPRWTVTGGTLVAGADVFHATVTPTTDACTVTITWCQLDGPPPAPSANR